MGRKPTSIYTKEALAEAVSKSLSGAETLRVLGLCISGSACAVLKRRIAEWEIDTSHWEPYKRAKKEPRKADEEFFVAGSSARGGSLRKRFMRAAVTPFRCSTTNCPTHSLDSWCGHPIPLHLDHEDGDRTNNQLGNLRWLCPTCHQLTETWGSKNHKPRSKPPTNFCPCGKQISKNAKVCRGCHSPPGARYLDLPDAVTLRAMIEVSNQTDVAKQLGVSRATIYKQINGLRKSA